MPTLNCNARIPDVTRGGTLKYGQAKNAVEVECVANWIDERDHSRGFYRLTLAGVIAKRANGPKDPQQLESKEVEGVIERMPSSAIFTPEVKYELLGAAREFYREATA